MSERFDGKVPSGSGNVEAGNLRSPEAGPLPLLPVRLPGGRRTGSKRPSRPRGKAARSADVSVLYSRLCLADVVEPPEGAAPGSAAEAPDESVCSSELMAAKKRETKGAYG